ncbi:hypothetical protein M436DRAFT_45182 [Aureobasidium namibiae CBS 147.97]|uniref:Uncharacterized protein n=1 Tax=Aureobasidium namibiae CBS 147.97 TaxID=1043004 RepID=A0A074WLH7_9PEZI|nr:uncharacterized protein M436DRAFT_45182 [Aureobasidium namibiae CBS 147.97]KEQ73978.1 hypothetical protein M436DRAFT_45182 [Aureobasidium namibiae CBS 147.97]
MSTHKTPVTIDQKLPYTFREDAYWAAEPEEITLFANIIVACAENHLSPLAAAQKITVTLTAESWSNKAVIDANNEDRPYRTNFGLVAVLIGSCVSSFPPHSVVHVRLFGMIKCFLRVEKREAPNWFLDQDGKPRSENFGAVDMRATIPLWESLKPLSFPSSCEWLADIGFPWTGAEKCGSQQQQRWRNLSYFCARLSVEGIEHMGWKSALQRLLPKYGMLDEKTVGWSGYLAGQVLAAAQWFAPDGHGLWVWRACCFGQRYKERARVGSDGQQDSGDELVQHALAEAQSNENDGNPGPWDDDELRVLMKSEDWLWNLDNWKVWKAAFKEITERVDDVRIHQVVRTEAFKELKIVENSETL